MGVKKSFSLALLASLNLSFLHTAAIADQVVHQHSEKEALSGHMHEKEPRIANKLKVLDKAELETLLDKRISSGMSGTFGPFANKFFVMSKIETGTCVGLNSKIKNAGNKELMPAFPRNYNCTLRELLEAIAMQMGAEWKYQVEDQVIMGQKAEPKEVDGIVIFSFVPKEQKIECTMTPAKNWTVKEYDSFTMFVPPISPMGLDIHACGKVSASTKEAEDKLLKTAPRDAALDELKRAKPDATEKDLKQTKVGEYDAYFFEAQLPPNGPEKIRWRQWHLAVGNQLYFVISTLLKEQDATLFPAVEEMIKTFRKR